MEFRNITEAKKLTGLSYLGNVNISAKIIKNQKVNKVQTYILYLSPAKSSGYEVCPFSTVECRLGCLATSGRNKMEIASNKNVINNARIKKTKLFFENNKFFMDWLVADIKAKKDSAINNGYGFSVRLNGTSDIDWENTLHNGMNIFQIFPDIQFYDYTKNPYKFNKISDNYHLTLSYTGRNWLHCKNVLSKGYNVAVVFNVAKNQSLPANFNGYKVIDGDITDYRVMDDKSVIVGLRWKNIANNNHNEHIKESIFVITP